MSDVLRPGAKPGAATRRRPRRIKPEAEIVLLCNPRAGGRWRELAGILDSEQARHVRRVVTDSVEDVSLALAGLAGDDTKLLCIYGGDGTIQRILDRLSPEACERVHVAMIGGGTMNVTARWCGMSGSPAKNFRAVIDAYRSGQLLTRKVPLLEVTHGAERHLGFTIGFGPIVRVLDAYERGRKGKLAAARIAAEAVAAVWTGYPARIASLVAPMPARVELDGVPLAFTEYTAVFANITGQLNPGVEPFVAERTRDTFYCAAYAVTPRELAVALPFLARGWIPFDPDILRRLPPWRNRGADAKFGPLPADPRYVNRTARSLVIQASHTLYTVDGELLNADSDPVAVALGHTIDLAVLPDS